MPQTHEMSLNGTQYLKYELKDLESRAHDAKTPSTNEFYDDVESHGTEELVEAKLSFLNRIAAGLSAETKGIEPITEDEKTDDSILNAASMWFSANMVLPAYAIGALGPMVFDLNFGQSVFVIIFFNLLGLVSVAFFSVFGAELGLRQMILSRYLVGNIAARIFSFINFIACIGWGIVNTVASSQVLNMVNPGHQCPLWAGCIVIIGATVIVTFSAMESFMLTRNGRGYQILPSKKFVLGEWTSGPTTAGNVLSFGSTVYGFAAGWTTYAADYTVYMPRKTNKYKIFFSLVVGLATPLYFTMILGAAVAMAAIGDPAWKTYYDENSIGGLTFAVLVPNSVHGFGQFCCVLLSLSTIANNVPNMYTIALSVQATWEPLAKVPRVIWTLLGNAAALGIAIPACYYFSTFMNYFMDSIGYYLAIYIAIACSEHFIYRRSFSAYNVDDWDSWERLPIGIAGTAALIVGAFGVALGMCQTYWVGEISRLIGDYGGDIGFELGLSWAFIVYNIARPFELKVFQKVTKISKKSMPEKLAMSMVDIKDAGSELRDLESGALDTKSSAADVYYEGVELHRTNEFIDNKPSFFNRIAAALNAETKGIEPVTDDEKNDDSILNAATIWFSANMVIVAYSVGALGPLVFGLNFGQSVLVIIFFNILGLIPVALFSLFGVELGLRQMILSRYLAGNITARFFSLVNVIACVGWCVLNISVSAQLLNMVNEGSGHNCPIWAGCLIIAGGTVLVTFFGYSVVHAYEKWSWVPNFAAFLVIIAQLSRSGKFKGGEWVGGATTAGGVLSFGSSVFGSAAGWATYAADYTVYMPKTTSKYKIFFSVVAGLAFPLFFTMILGVACGMAALNDPTWKSYYDKNAMGGVIYAILVPNSLNGFGQFCCVLLALSTVANNVPGMYTVALSAQALWAPLAKIPRVVWTMAGNAATLGISIPATYYFDGFMENFMDSIGYYLAIYIAIACSEHFIYRRSFSAYNIDDWDNWEHLPIGIAGTAALIAGAFGVALGMCQTYWVGEISRLIGEYGGDIGFELGGSWAFIIYNIVRPLELKYFGR
ncbi:BGN_3a_G0014980.mRNA.1.CDS.1 [Saccharomyces cerevisiae]|nr:BGN_3a_G0014980.mRNA.1.CDS.1 [Saccharomyces cerevisiae]CAI7101150.1 BGN_3a_G0014980.mRNA.1.CDS.1 [Saccharomyces cerevisiae]